MPEPKTNEQMEKIVSLCKRRGFIFQSSEIYGGLNGFWDYGPLGAELKRNVKDYWWRSMTRQREDIAGLDATIIMHPKIWEASGHTSTFSDPMVDCLLTKKRFRADQIEPQSGIVYFYSGADDEGEEPRAAASNALASIKGEQEPPAGDQALETTPVKTQSPRRIAEPYSVLVTPGRNAEQAARSVAERFYRQRGLAHPCPRLEKSEPVENTTRYNAENGSLLTEPRPFNLMFKTYVGPVESPDNIAYLRPETAQAIFAQFKTVLEVSRQKVPFGICQIGKAFRNEINPRNFTFRSREFEQMELEFFIRPDEVAAQLRAAADPGGTTSDPQRPGLPGTWGWNQWHDYWIEQRLAWYESIGLGRDCLDLYHQPRSELAHYAKATVDILYRFPFGTQELEGIAARGDFDLRQHEKFSGKSMQYFDEEAKARYIPHVIEPSAGVDRLVLALICQAYHEEEVTDDKGATEKRIVMRFHPRIAPVKAGIFPLLKNRPELVGKAREIRDLLSRHLTVFYDESGAIGRRYRRQDEAGTPFGITIDFDTLDQSSERFNTVTLRHRDSMKQERIQIEDLLRVLMERIA